jgi:hypothetical protein
MDKEQSKTFINDFFEDYLKNRPTKDVFQKCLMECIIEKNNLVSDGESNKDLLDRIDKVIESIQVYLSVTSK